METPSILPVPLSLSNNQAAVPISLTAAASYCNIESFKNSPSSGILMSYTRGPVDCDLPIVYRIGKTEIGVPLFINNITPSTQVLSSLGIYCSSLKIT